MKLSNLFTKTTKNNPKDETSLNAQILIRAGFIDKLGAGIYSYLPLGLIVINKIIKIVKEEMALIGGQELLLPALNPSEYWEATGRYNTFDALFKIEGNNLKKYVLGATHEEIITPLVKKFIFSYQDLPFSVYQVQTKFRNEKRAKAGLIRGREFVMKDMYSFHVSQEDLDKYYEKVKNAYFEIYKRLGLEKITYLTYASGGAFSQYSHEFQTLTESGEDHIYICEHCGVAINHEIIDIQSNCPMCGNNDLLLKKGVEVGNIFKLGNRFSKPFNVTYVDKKGNQNDVIMGCYGFGPSRVMGIIAEIFNDKKGLIWPKSIAPFKIHLISLHQNNYTEEIYRKLVDSGVEVIYDDRDLSAGQKFYDADLIGCPYRVVIGKKFTENGQLEIKQRSDGNINYISLDQLISNYK
jgi:prolyl-tRNA synthetase